MRVAAWILAGAGLALGQWETGAVVRSDGGAFVQNTIPQVGTLGDGSLLVVWGASTVERRVRRIEEDSVWKG